VRRAAAVLFGAAMTLSGCGPIGSGAPVSELWEAHCQRCHGVDGRGVPALRGVEPELDLTKSRMVRRGRRAEIRRIIAAGDVRMPGFGHRLPNGDVEALVDLVLSMSREEVR